MEGGSNQENPLQKMLFTSGGTISHVSGSSGADDDDDPDMQRVAAAERSGSQWTCLPKPSHNYVQYLTESSNYLPKTELDMIESNYAPVGGISDVNETDKNFFYNDPGKACAFKTNGHSSTEADIGKVGLWRPDEGEVHQEAMQFESAQHQHILYTESPASWAAESVGDKHAVSRPDPMAMAGAPCFLPKPGSSSSTKQKNTDRQRRLRMADNLKALHDLLPNRPEGSEAYILDDIIDHVKYLQLQLKELSGIRVHAESTANVPLVFHEGYGHYIDQQVLNEPLEEMMGKLLEEHPAAANQLLESKGLVLLPMDLAEDLRQAMQMFGGNALV